MSPPGDLQQWVIAAHWAGLLVVVLTLLRPRDGQGHPFAKKGKKEEEETKEEAVAEGDGIANATAIGTANGSVSGKVKGTTMELRQRRTKGTPAGAEVANGH